MNIKKPTDTLNRMNSQEYRDSGKAPVFIVLDNLRSALNVGSIFRSADSFRCAEILLCGISALPPNRELNKTALGATESVSWVHVEHTIDAVLGLKSRGVIVYAVEQVSRSISLESMPFQQDVTYAFVFGNEVEGVSQEVIDACDGCIEIPQFGTKHSLNVAVCAGIVLWESAGRLHNRNL